MEVIHSLVWLKNNPEPNPILPVLMQAYQKGAYCIWGGGGEEQKVLLGKGELFPFIHTLPILQWISLVLSQLCSWQKSEEKKQGVC